MSAREDLIPGAFYWAMPACDPDAEFAWEYFTQPARFAGYDENGQERWNWLNVDGVSEWPARWIGDRLLSPRGDEADRMACAEAQQEWD